jgi:hypothetical protein
VLKAFVAAPRPTVRLVAGIAFALWLSLGGPASARAQIATSEAPSQEAPRALLPFRTDVHGLLTWEAELGTGLRADILLSAGTSAFAGRDELALSVGCDVSFVTWNGGNRVTLWPTATVQWALSVSERFVFYPELGIVAQVRPHDFRGLYPNVGFGGRIHVVHTLDVLVRLGWPMAVSIGLTF